MPYALRTRFKQEIVAEFAPPAGSRARRVNRVAIICSGAPGMPPGNAMMTFLSKKGFWVISPRYRGTWESDGAFLRKSPEQDILDIIDQLPRGFTSAGDGKKYRVRPDEIVIIASSFGGPAGILASRDPRVSNIIAISPVVDWQAPSKVEPLDWLARFFHDAFGNGYRFGSRAAARRTWKKLASGTFYNPVRHADEIDGSKIFIFHARDDQSVRAREVIRFARITGAALKLLPHGGHLSSGRIVPKYWKQIAKFLK